MAGILSNFQAKWFLYTPQSPATEIAQLVNHWAPCDGSTHFGYKSLGLRHDERLMFMSLLMGMVVVDGRA